MVLRYVTLELYITNKKLDKLDFYQNEKLLCSQRHYQESKKATHRTGGNNWKLYLIRA